MKTNLEIVREFYETLNPELVDPDADWNVTDGFFINDHYHGRQAAHSCTALLIEAANSVHDLPG